MASMRGSSYVGLYARGGGEGSLLPGPVAGHHVESLDHRREGHSGVDVPFWHMDPEALGNQRGSDHQQEGEGQHDDRGVGTDEVSERVGGGQHHGHRDEDRDDHDGDMLGHADGGDDAVHREDEVEDQDLGDGGGKADGRGPGVEHVRVWVRVHVVMDFLCCLPDEEQTAGDQDQVAPRETLAENFNDRLGELDDDGNRAEKDKAHPQGAADPNPSCPLALFDGKLVRQDRDEDQIVDPQHHFHGDQRDEGGPGRRVGGELREVFDHVGSPDLACSKALPKDAAKVPARLSIWRYLVLPEAMAFAASGSRGGYIGADPACIGILNAVSKACRGPRTGRRRLQRPNEAWGGCWRQVRC